MRNFEEIYQDLEQKAPEIKQLDLTGMLSMVMGFMQAASTETDFEKRKQHLANMVAVSLKAFKMEVENGEANRS